MNIIKHIVTFLVVVATIWSSDLTDGCDLPESATTGYIHLTADGSVLYKSVYAIGGFQFDVDGASVLSGSGGDMSASGLIGQSLGSTFLSFSLSGSSIPAGCGTLVNLSLSGDATGLSNIIFSDATAAQIYFEYYTGAVLGCTDMNACNYDSDATEEDGTCDYAQENFDCNGNCIVEIDCNGDCGGSAELDECNVCDGDGIADGECDCEGTLIDCNNECGGSATLDSCNVCSGGSSGHVADSDIDECGVCFGDNSSCLDCSGTPNGSAFYDDCGVCSAGNSGHEANSDQDCNGVCFGDAYLDECDICSEGNTDHEANSDQDCNGVCFGDAYLDECGICDGEGIIDGECDCDGNILDACGVCGGGELNSENCTDCFGISEGTGQVDECGECIDCSLYSNDNCVDHPAWNQSCIDCSGEISGDAAIDACGNCVAPGTAGCILDCEGDFPFDVDNYNLGYTNNCGECYPFSEDGTTNINDDCEIDCYGVWGGQAQIDNCGVCTGGSTELEFDYLKDCQGVCGGTAAYDNCGECNSDPVDNCVPDCAGEWGGEALEDDCGVCSGGISGHDANSDLDECGICFGDDSSCSDCAGVPNGFSSEDNCGVCDTNPDNDCIQDCSGVWGGDLVLDECGICGGDSTLCQDCAGVPNGDALDLGCGCGEPGPSGCDNQCGSNAVEDECGVCDGNNSSCMDCSGVPNGDALDLGCGCGEPGPSGCDNQCGSNAIEDECGVCDGDGSSCSDCNGVPYGNSVDLGCGCDEPGPSGCDNECGSTLEEDECGVCGGDNSTCLDCEGVVNGDAVEDICGECNGPGAIYACGCEPLPEGACNCDGDIEIDCNGLCGGTAIEDDCGVCDGSAAECENGLYDLTGECVDGNGQYCDCDGNIYDECEICGGSGEPSTGICDCNGDPNGDAVEDDCGVCNGSVVECADGLYDFTGECVDDTGEYCDCDGNIYDECEICGGDNTECADCAGEPNGTAVEDCAGVCNGGSVVDICGNCDDDTSNDCQPDCSQSEEECNGIWLNDQCWGGTAQVDECGECGGSGLNEFGCCGSEILNCSGDCVLIDDTTNDGSEQCYEDPQGTFCDINDADECGICFGSGFEEDYCDCYSNVINCDGECPTIYSGTPGIWYANPDYDNTDSLLDLDNDAICDDIDDCVSVGSSHLIFDANGSQIDDAFLGGYDICGECNGDGFGCEAMLQAEGQNRKIELNWWGPNDLSLEGIVVEEGNRSNRGGDNSTSRNTLENDRPVKVTLENLNTEDNTIDVYMLNVPSCSYCSDPVYNSQYNCEAFSDGAWSVENNMSESECNSNNGIFFDGYVGGFQFELFGVDIIDATAPENFIVNASPTTIVGFSLSGATIAPSQESQLLTTITFENFEKEICFGEDTGSSGSTALADAAGEYIITDWGSCSCADAYPADDCGVCGGIGVQQECGCGEVGLMDDNDYLIYELPEDACDCDEITEYIIEGETYLAGIPRFTSDRVLKFINGAWTATNDFLCWDQQTEGCFEIDCPYDPNALSYNVYRETNLQNNVLLASNLNYPNYTDANLGFEEDYCYRVSYLYDSNQNGIIDLDTCIYGTGDNAEDCELSGGYWGEESQLSERSCATTNSEELGCIYPSACNYDDDANSDDGSCWWPDTGCGCDDGEESNVDACGICNGDNSTCSDCAGVPYGDNQLDNCGNCDNDLTNDCVPDCAGVWGGNSILDQCNVCNGDNSSCDQGCGPNQPGPSGCDNLCGSTAEFDDCGVCGGDNSSCNWTTLNGELQDINNIKLSWDEFNFSDGDRYAVGGRGGSFNSSRNCEAEVCISIENIDYDLGTLDIFMINQSACSYCTDSDYTDKIPCEIGGFGDTGLGSAEWIVDTNLNEQDCISLDGKYFDGHVGGFQFGLAGITVTAVTEGPTDYDLSISNVVGSPNVLGFSLTGGSIPPGSGKLVKVDFTAASESICFQDNVCGEFYNGPCNQVSDTGDSDLQILPIPLDAVWGECICNGNLDCTGDCNGLAYFDNCDICVGGASGESPCTVDCAGVFGGDSTEDICGVCEGPGEEYECWNGTLACGPTPDQGCPLDPSQLTYNIYRNGLGLPHIQVQNITEIVDENLDYEEQYCYTITYSSGGFESTHSNQVCIFTEPMPIVEGCMSTYACNYDLDATVDDGSCWFKNTGCECENGEGALDLGCGCGEPGPSGCDNVCGSTAIEDECGVCGGDNMSCADCEGVPNGNALDLGCGCGEPGPSGCDNVCGSTAIEDECGVCGGPGYLEDLYNTGAECCPANGEADQCGVCGGSAVKCSNGMYDLTGLCVDDVGEYCDCDGNVYDQCGVCGGDDSTCSWTNLRGDLQNINEIMLSWDGAPTSDDNRGNRGSRSNELTDGCDLPESSTTGYLHLTASGAVLYNSPNAIAGFEFRVDGALIVEGAGGDMEEYGLTNQALDSDLLAFSLTGSFIPAGCGTLVNLTLNGLATGLSNLVVADPNALSLYFEYYSCSVGEDCNGDCGGDAFVDNCGECVGGLTGSEACFEDCAGVINGPAIEDECGICNGPGKIYECWNGEFTCGPSPNEGCPLDPSQLTYNIYRNGMALPHAQVQNITEFTDIGLNYEEQYCYTVTYSSGDYESYHSNQVCFITEPMEIIEGCMSIYACNYDLNATVDDGSCWFSNTGCECSDGEGATSDNCGICDVDPSNNCTADCSGVWGGNAYIDECGKCDAVPSNDCIQDCSGEWGGVLVEDECGVCGGDNGSCLDECGVVNGDNSFCSDCLGIPNGIAVEETMDSLYIDFWGLTSADIDCCGSGDLDLCGVCDGPGQVYDCGCTGFPIDSSEDSPTYKNQACDCNASIFSDDCGACGGTQYFKIVNINSSGDLLITDQDCEPSSGRKEQNACLKVEDGEIVLFEDVPVCDCENNYLDVCGTCGGTEFDPSKCEKIKDCAGVLDGDSFEDNCGNCIGGELALAGECLIDGAKVTIPNLDSLLLLSDLDYSNPLDFCDNYGECSIDTWDFAGLDTTTILNSRTLCEDYNGDGNNIVGRCSIENWNFAGIDTTIKLDSQILCEDYNGDGNNVVGSCSIDKWDFADLDTTGTILNTEELCMKPGLGECSIETYNNADDCECWGGEWSHSQWSSSYWESSIWIDAVWDSYIAEDYSCETDCADSADVCNANWVEDEENVGTGACWGDPADSNFGVLDCNDDCNGGAFIDNCSDCVSTEEEACIFDCSGEDNTRLNTCFYILKTSETDSTYNLDRGFDLNRYLEITQQTELEDDAETTVENLCSTPTSSSIEELSYPYISYAYFSEDGSDECGVCGGDNFMGPSNTFEYGSLEGECSCASLSCDCNDNCLSAAFFDDCGVCDSDPTNDCSQGCDGVWGSGKEFDCTTYEGECDLDGDGVIDKTIDTDGDGILDSGSEDCEASCGGSAPEDDCGVCLGGTCLSSAGVPLSQYENELDCINQSGVEGLESIWSPGDIEFDQGKELWLERIYVCEHPNINWSCDQAPCWIENEGDTETFEVPITKLDCQQIMNGIQGDWGIAGTEWDMLNQYGECDCEGNKLDCKGVCGGDDYTSCDNVDLNGNWCIDDYFDECGTCFGIGIKDGECDCFGNIANCAGECPTIKVEGVSMINPDWTPIDGEDLDFDGICDSDVNGNEIDPCVSLMSPHLIFELDENGAPVKVDPSGGKDPVKHGGYDVCGVCNGNGFSCGSEIKPGFEEIEIHWRKPFDNDPFIIEEDVPMGRAKSDGGSNSGGYGLYNNMSLNSSSSDAAVTVYLDNVDLAAGTLDIVTTNRPRCGYCSDDEYSTKSSCNQYGIDDAIWEYSETISENDCASLNGEWFSGDIGGYQITLLGVTVLNASAPFGFNVSTSETTILGFSLTGGTIPPGINQVITTVSFAVDPSGTGIIFGEDTGSSGSTALSDATGGYIDTNWELPFCYAGYDMDDCGVCGGTGVQQECGCGEVGLMDNSGTLIYELPDGACDCEEMKVYTIGGEKYMAGIPRYSSDRKQNFTGGTWSNSNYFLCWDKSTEGCFETDCPPDPGAVSFNVYREMPIGGGAYSLVLRESGLIYNSFRDEGLGYEQEFTYAVSYTYDNKEYFLTDSGKYENNQDMSEAKRLTATTDALVPGCTFPSSCGYDNDNPPNFYMEGSCWWPSLGCSCTDLPGSIVDDCGVCDLNMENDGYEDGCGVCDNNPDNDDADMDCAGVCGGEAVDTWCDDTCGMSGPKLDACGNCDGTCEADAEGFITCSESNKNIIDADCAGNCYDYVDPDGEDGDLPVSGTSLHGTCIGGWFGFAGGNIDQEECENTDGYWSEYGYDGCGECVGDSEYIEGSCLSLYNGLIPDDFSIRDIYPNPFNPYANIVYGIPQYSNVKIAVYDIKGREVTILQNEMQSPGYYEIHWDASAFSSGVYFIEMRSEDFRQIKRVLHMK